MFSIDLAAYVLVYVSIITRDLQARSGKLIAFIIVLYLATFDKYTFATNMKHIMLKVLLPILFTSNRLNQVQLKKANSFSQLLPN